MSQSPTPPSTPSPSPSPAPARRPALARALLRPAVGLARLFGTTLALLVALLLSAWLWSGHARSLPLTLDWLQGWLGGPDSEGPLLVRDASGSLREGGRIGYLRWRRNGLEIELEDLQLRWPASLWPDLLLRRELRLDPIDPLQLARLRLRDDSPPSADRQPPTDLLLPWLESVQLPLRVEAIVIEGSPQLALGPLQADYRYRRGPDGDLRHELQLQQLHWAQGQYQLQAQLQASAPMQLDAQLQGLAQASLPGGRRQSLSAQASLRGQLAGQAASLAFEASVNPTASAQTQTRAGAGAGATLKASATITPWATLPLPTAELELREIDLAAFWPQAPRTRLQSRWQASSRSNGPDATAQDARWELAGELRNSAAGPWQRGALPLEQLRAALAFAGGAWQLQTMEARLSDNGRLQAAGSWSGQRVELRQAELKLADASAKASGRLELGNQQLDGALNLALPGANASAQARASGGQLQLALTDAQQLQRWLNGPLKRWLPAGIGPEQLPEPWRSVLWRGQASLQAGWTGPLHTDRLPRDWNAKLQAPQAQVQWPAASDLPALQLKDWQLALAGHDQAVTLSLAGAATSADWSASSRLRASGQFGRDRQGPVADIRLELAELQLSDATRQLSGQLTSPGGTPLRWDSGGLTVAPGRASLALSARDGTAVRAPAELAWDSTRWSNGRLESRGRATGLALGWIDTLLVSTAAPRGPLAQAGLSGELTLQGSWDLSLPLQPTSKNAPATRARIELARSGGDLNLLLPDSTGGKPQAVGVEQVAASVMLDGAQLQSRLRWTSRLAGRLDAELGTLLAPPSPALAQWSWPAEAALTGRVQAELPQFGLWSSLLPPGWRLRGSLQADATLSGTRRQPEWHGQLQVNELALRSLVDGLDFSGGELRATLAGDQLRFDSLKLRGAGGDNGGLLLGNGLLRWSRPDTPAGQAIAPLLPVMTLDLQARQLRLLARADRRLTLSGRLAVRMDEKLLDATGRLVADQALFILPDENRPTLGEDVVVRGQGQPAAANAAEPARSSTSATAKPIRLRLELGLGDDFQLRGQGLDSQLKGELLLSLDPGQSVPQLTGQVRTERGQYRAWGQRLEIETGLLNFNGPYDNPTLELLALRPLPDQRVGVQLSGTALAPRLRLYADPDLPESEKLAWLVLGRPAGGTGAETALLQQAALALFSRRSRANEGGFQRSLGLDELSFQGETQRADGSAQAAALTLGKRISRQLYLSYSRSVVGTTGTVAILYDLARHLTLRAQAGDDNAIELIYTRQYDGRRARSSPAAPKAVDGAATMRGSSP